MKVSSLKFKVQSFLKNLSAVYGLLSGAKLYKLSLRGARPLHLSLRGTNSRSNLMTDSGQAPQSQKTRLPRLRLAMTCKHNECVCINKRGFTLIEIIMIMIIAAIAIPALLFLLGEGAKQGAYSELRVTATEAGQALMEEIKSKRWDENVTPPPYTTPLGPEGVENRTVCSGTPSTYNDVDDYNGYSEPCTWNGASFTTGVQVCYVPAANLNDTSTCNATTDYKRIQVDVTNTNLGTVSLVTVVTNY